MITIKQKQELKNQLVASLKDEKGKYSGTPMKLCDSTLFRVKPHPPTLC